MAPTYLSPGHIDFCTEVYSAVNLTDIALLIIDAVFAFSALLIIINVLKLRLKVFYHKPNYIYDWL